LDRFLYRPAIPPDDEQGSVAGSAVFENDRLGFLSGGDGPGGRIAVDGEPDAEIGGTEAGRRPVERFVARRKEPIPPGWDPGRKMPDGA